MLSIEELKCYQYAIDVRDEKFVTNSEIKISCRNFLENLEKSKSDTDYPYFFDVEFANVIIDMTKLVNMASGIKAGTPVHDSLADFQWFFILNTLCWKYKNKPEKRQYEKSLLLIARKSGKTFLVALLFILLLLLEPEYSEFYSVAPDRELSSIIKKEMAQTIEKSPYIAKHFKIVRDEIRCLLTNSKFIPLATSDNRMDGRKANVFVADEVGALKNRYPIDAMKSSQMNMINRTGILISTAYESLSNPMVDETNYASKVLAGEIKDDKLFALLYRPDDNTKWTDDDELIKSNPLAVDIEENYEYLKEQRALALNVPAAQKNFKTKHMNIFVDGSATEVYIATEDLIKNRLEEDFDWTNKDVFLGVDLAQSNDNTAVSMVHFDQNKDLFYIKSWAFIPGGNIETKSKVEKIDYDIMIENGLAFASGDSIISYKFVEDFVINLPQKYGVNIKGIGYDKWNAVSSANKWDDFGFETVEVPQTTGELHRPTKLLKEYVLEEKAKYDSNILFEKNVANAREIFDDNLRSRVSKRKSKGKIDMLAATIDAFTLWNIEIDNGRSVYEDREIRIL